MPLQYFTALMVRGDRVRVHAVRRQSPDVQEYTVVSAEGRVALCSMQDVTTDAGYMDVVTAALEGRIDAACTTRHAGMLQEQAADAFIAWWQKAMHDGFQYVTVP